MKVLYSVAAGRPPGAPASRGYSLTWACWWSGDPRREPGRRPDASGGACERAEVPDLVRMHVRAFAKTETFDLEALPAAPCRAWRREWWYGGQPPPPPRVEPQAEFKFKDNARRRRAYEPPPPPASSPADRAFAMLGLAPDATANDVRRAFRRKAFEMHPDRGGSHEAFVALERAYRVALISV